MMLVIASCVSEEEPVEIPISDAQQAVEDAKAWFGPQEEFEVLVLSGANAKAKARTKKIQWNKVITHENWRVIEVAVKYSAHAVPMRDDTTTVAIKEKQKSSFYRLLIRKDSLGNYSKSILKFFPEQNEKDQSDLEVNNFMSLSSQFSGDIQLTDWDENLETGWLIANGNVVEQYYEKKYGIKEKSYANAVVECRNVEKEVCTYYYEDNPLYEEGIGYEEQNVMECHIYIVPECSEIDEEGPGWAGGTPTGPGGGGGSGSGSGTGSGDGTGGPRLLPEDEEQVTNNLTNPCASEIFVQTSCLLDYSGIGPAALNSLNINNGIISMFANATNFEYTIKQGNISSGANANTLKQTGGGGVVVTLNNSYLNSATKLSIARTMIHENLHAYFLQQTATTVEFATALHQFSINNGNLNLPNTHHELMRQYVLGMAFSLALWDENYGNNQNQLDFEYYIAMACGGLLDYDTGEPNEAFVAIAGDKLKEYLKILSDEATNAADAKSNPC